MGTEASHQSMSEGAGVELRYAGSVEGLTEVRPGDVLAGKYRIERVLGQGGMGVVVSAHHLQLDERIAIKFLLPQALDSAEAVARFAREARAAVKIKSEHVARVIDVGTLETGSPYMVMEYLHGHDLGALVQDRGALPVEDATDYVLQACEAIAEAHSLGIVHRDLKPQNLFLTHRADGSSCIKVLDFGISKVSSPGTTGSGSRPEMSMTKTTAVMGSPLYMSPEQMTSARDVDARTDIWALGVILYELLTGRVPFFADTVPQLCAMILQAAAPPLRNFRPDAPEGLQNVLLRCLEKDPLRRHRNVAELATALLPFAPRSSRTSVERISRVLGAGASTSNRFEPPASSLNPTPLVTQAAWGQTLPGSSRAPWILLALGVLGAGGTAVAVFASRSVVDAGPGPSSAVTQSPVSALAPSQSPPLPVPSSVLAPRMEGSGGKVTALASALAPASARIIRTTPRPVALSRRVQAPAAPTPTPASKPPPKPEIVPVKSPTRDLYGDRK